MGKCYVKAYYDWIEQTAALSDAERGRLFIAILEYARSGLEPKLDGREGILFPAFKSMLDRDAQISAAKAQNGAKGGRSNKANKSKQKQNEANESKHKLTKDKDKDKDEDNKENSPNGEQKKVAADADAIFAEVYQAWERASGKCASIAQSEELQTLLEEYGRENMLYAIKQGVNHNAVTLAYIKAVLRGGKRGNKSSGKRDKQEKSYIPNKQGKFADITDDLL